MKFSTHLMQHQFEMVWQWKYFEDTQMKRQEKEDLKTLLIKIF